MSDGPLQDRAIRRLAGRIGYPEQVTHPQGLTSGPERRALGANVLEPLDRAEVAAESGTDLRAATFAGWMASVRLANSERGCCS